MIVCRITVTAFRTVGWLRPTWAAIFIADKFQHKFQFKGLDNPEPLFTGDPELIYPSTGEVVEGMSASLASESLSGNSLDFIAVTSYAETTVNFPT